jgi:hypothetical protein
LFQAVSKVPGDSFRGPKVGVASTHGGNLGRARRIPTRSPPRSGSLVLGRIKPARAHASSTPCRRVRRKSAGVSSARPKGRAVMRWLTAILLGVPRLMPYPIYQCGPPPSGLVLSLFATTDLPLGCASYVTDSESHTLNGLWINTSGSGLWVGSPIMVRSIGNPSPLIGFCESHNRARDAECNQPRHAT